MRNKSDLDTLSMDDLCNNLKVYKPKIKSQSISSSNSQNVAFVSSDNSSITNRTVNTAHSVSPASSKYQASTASYADDVMFSFFSNQSNSPQLDNEDLEQIDSDDLKEIDIKWQAVMLTIRVKRFIKRITRKLDLNGKETIRFDRTKAECYNYHRRGHFAKECRAPRNQGNRNRDAPTRNAPIDTSTTNALVHQVHQIQTLRDDNQINDRFKKGEGYHVVTLPYTGNYMPPRADLSFAGLDNSVFKSLVSETITSVPKIETNASKTSKDSLEKPKAVRAASSVSAARHVNTAASRPNVINALPTTYSHFKAHSQDQGIFHSRCSRNMNGNKSYLIDYQEIDGGFFAFGGNAKKVSQMCDTKNNVLLTDNKCVVLSLNFKLLEESQVLLKVPRNNNMYSLDLKNVVPVGGIENQMDHKVKTIRYDNRTEFKNRIMNEFHKIKGIRREFSIAKTPQQNGVAKKKK
uniref:Uncharacterized protein n=1 Tax=Tanacetum cinerariifolium TaxID=118510 RepID=A0A6L2MPD9_TANCI|nr:hypothetical protein [Tanacetum cinerariifolium]